MAVRHQPVWRRYSLRERALIQIADAIDAELVTWPPSTDVAHALHRAERAIRTARQCVRALEAA